MNNDLLKYYQPVNRAPKEAARLVDRSRYRVSSGRYEQKPLPVDILPTNKGDRSGSGGKRVQLGDKEVLASRVRNKNSPKFKVLAAVIIFAVSLLLPAASPPTNSTEYRLNDEIKNVIGDVDSELSTKIVYDNEKRSYIYNKKSNSFPVSPEPFSKKATAGAENYAAEFYEDKSNGTVTYDVKNDLSIKLVPGFKTASGRLVEGRVMYPIEQYEDSYLFYTLKGNGVKEDIVLTEYISDSLSFSYDLELPEYLEARPHDNGSIGIYGGDYSLFSGITYGSEEDRSRIELARMKAVKNNLLFIIPAPFVVDQNGLAEGASASYYLEGKTLTLKASGLSKVQYPISIDPSVVVTSATDFSRGNSEDNINVNGAGNEIEVALPSGGTISSWTTDGGTSFTTGRRGHTSVAHNGYLYVIGGRNVNTLLSDVQYAPIDSDGSIGTWSATSSFSTGRHNHSSVIYNNYLYVIGGFTGSDQTTDVQYAPIRPDGTLGSWTATTNFTTKRMEHSSVAYNGYIYLLGGCAQGSCSSAQSNTQYAPINADGTLGTWTATTSLPVAIISHESVVYNGYIYTTGGNIFQGGNRVYYAPLNADGTIGSWNLTSLLPGEIHRHSNAVYNGYMYVFGGRNPGGTQLNTVYYAPINSDGTVGAWFSTTAMTDEREQHDSVAYNGYVYFIGGDKSSTQQNDVRYAPINPAGVTAGYAASPTFANASFGISTVAYNGYLYVIGGCSAGNCTTVQNTVRYAAIANDGTIGSFTTSGNNLAGARYGHASFAYNGRLYVVGGCSSTTSTCSTFSNSIQYSGTISAGNPGAWTDDTSNPFTTGRFWHTAVEHNGYVYVIGGCSSGDCSTYHNDVQVAPINSGGDIGSFNTENSFTTARYKHASVIAGGYLYVVGGYSGSFHNDVQYAPVNGDGSLGSWSSTSNFHVPRAGHTVAVNNGYMYVIAGCSAGASCSTFQSDVQYAPLHVSGSLGSWMNTTPITTARFGHGSEFYNGRLYTIGGCTSGSCSTFNNQVQFAGQEAVPRVGRFSYLIDLEGDARASSFYYRGSSGVATNRRWSFRTAPSSGAVFGSSLPLGVLGSGSLYSFPESERRYYQLYLVLDDSRDAAFPGLAYEPANISDFELFYHPLPGKRLRGGKTFTTEILQSLDASPQ